MGLRRIAWALIITCGLLLLGACATPTTRAYSGNTLPQDQVAILTVDLAGVFAVQPVLRTLDGQIMYKWLGRVDMKIEITPGHHRASVWYSKENLGLRDCAAEDQFVDFIAEPGHTYQVQANVRAGLACALGGSRKWTAAIVDVTAGAQPPQQ